MTMIRGNLKTRLDRDRHACHVWPRDHRACCKLGFPLPTLIMFSDSDLICRRKRRRKVYYTSSGANARNAKDRRLLVKRDRAERKRETTRRDRGHAMTRKPKTRKHALSLSLLFLGRRSLVFRGRIEPFLFGGCNNNSPGGLKGTPCTREDTARRINNAGSPVFFATFVFLASKMASISGFGMSSAFFPPSSA
jgi:hypothetical protein